jgi:hypothetical protein
VCYAVYVAVMGLRKLWLFFKVNRFVHNFKIFEQNGSFRAPPAYFVRGLFHSLIRPCSAIRPAPDFRALLAFWMGENLIARTSSKPPR